LITSTVAPLSRASQGSGRARSGTWE
jgi:hypothetical protein